MKKIEEMTNEEFAEYLVKEIPKIRRIRNHVFYCNHMAYNGYDDNINFLGWHYKNLTNKFKWCCFNEKVLLKVKVIEKSL